MRTSSMNLANPTVVRAPKSCARCGRIFGAHSREYICQICRRPESAGEMETVSRELSFRERQVVMLVREAKANKEIAAELRLTEGTIKEYLHRVFRKLGVKNRTELALRRDNQLTYEHSSPPLRELGSSRL
jgi:DNA-binding NarL/FixJ family response regulator